MLSWAFCTGLHHVTGRGLEVTWPPRVRWVGALEPRPLSLKGGVGETGEEGAAAFGGD